MGLYRVYDRRYIGKQGKESLPEVHRCTGGQPFYKGTLFSYT